MKSKMFTLNQSQKNTRGLSKFFSFLFVFAIVLGGGLVCEEAEAATVYAKSISDTVYYESGASGCDDVTIADTAGDLEGALTVAGTDGTLYICAGTYSGTEIDASDCLDTKATGQTIIGVGSAVIDGVGISDDVISISHHNTTIQNLTIQGASSGKYNLTGNDRTGTVLSDSILQNGSRAFVLLWGTPTMTMTNVKIIGHTDSSYSGGLVNAGTLTANYCIWENNQEPFRIDGSAIAANINNPVFIGHYNGAVRISSTAAVVDITNAINSVGVTNKNSSYPFINQSGTLNLSNSIILPNGLLPESYFLLGVTESSNNYVSPLFISPRRFGWVSLFVDDLVDWEYFKTLADYAATKGVGAVFAINSTDIVSAETFAEFSTYIANGHEIANHTRNHPRLTNMNAITITGRSGSTPTISVSINQTDNSSDNWSGTVTLMEDGATVETINVTSATTLTSLATSIALQTGWSASVHASAKGYCMAITLDDIASQSVALAWTAQFEQNKFWYYEIAESKAELETGIGGGYIVKTFVCPFNATNATLQSWLADDANFTNAGTTAFTIARGSQSGGSSYTLSDDETDAYNTDANGFRIMKLITVDADSQLKTNQDRDLAAFTSLLTWIGGYASVIAHNTGEYTQEQWQTLIDTIVVTPAMSIVLPRNAANTIRTGGLWTDADGDGLRWIRTFTNQENYQLQYLSPAIDSGTDVSLTTDYAGNNIYGTPDIGAYEYQPPYTIGANEIDTTGDVRIYADGKFRNTATAGGTTADLSITPSGGFGAGDYSEWMNVDIDTWNTTGTYYKKWTETSDNSSLTSSHAVGDLSASTYYTVWYTKSGEDKTRLITEQADGSSQIAFTYDQGYSDVIFEIEEDTTSPVAFTLLSPADNNSTSNSQPTFSWNASSDTESGLSHYQLYIDNALNTNNINGTSVSPANDLSCGAHTWFIRAVDNAANTTDSGSFNLTMACGGGLISPAPPVILSPTFEITTTNNQATINLSNIENVYQIAISTTPDFEYVSWEPYEENIVLPDTNKVYIKFRSEAGGVSEVYEIGIDSETEIDLETGTGTNNLLNLLNGSLVRMIDDYKVFVINNFSIDSGQAYIRHVIDEIIFTFYGHLNKDDIQEIDPSLMDNYQESYLIREANDYKVYKIENNKKHWLNMTVEEFAERYDWDEVYVVNGEELGWYEMVEDVKN